MNTLSRAIAIDPIAEAVFVEHGLDKQLLNVIEVKAGDQRTCLATSNGRLSITLEASLFATPESQDEIPHKIAHLLLDHLNANKFEIFATDRAAVTALDRRVIASSASKNSVELYRTFRPFYDLLFVEPKAATGYFNRVFAQLKPRQLHKLQFTPEQQDVLNKFRVAAVEMKTQAYLVGGCLRDKLLGIENHDLDFMVVSDDIKRFVQFVAQKYNLRQPVHLERSDSWTLRIGSTDVDIIEARKVYTPLTESSGKAEKADPSLEGEEEFSIALDDAYRRDLTINALMYDLNKNEVVDPTDRGFADLKAGLINTIIDPFVKYRINAADMLRALRFAAVLNFKLGPEMLEAMRTNAFRLKPRDKGGDISTRRIRRELRKAAETAESWYRFKRFIIDAGVIDYITEDVEDVEKDRTGASPKDDDK